MRGLIRAIGRFVLAPWVILGVLWLLVLCGATLAVLLQSLAVLLR